MITRLQTISNVLIANLILGKLREMSGFQYAIHAAHGDRCFPAVSASEITHGTSLTSNGNVCETCAKVNLTCAQC